MFGSRHWRPAVHDEQIRARDYHVGQRISHAQTVEKRAAMSEVITEQDKEYEAREQAAAPGDDQPMNDRVNNRSLRPRSDAFVDFMSSGWDNNEPEIERLESASYIPARLQVLSEAFPGERLVIPAGQPKVRNNDCDYAFRPDSAFSYYTGLGQDYEAGAVLVLDPNEDGTHTPMLFVAPRADHYTQDFFKDPHYGEYWVGPRAGLKELEAMTGIETHDIAQLDDMLGKDVGTENGAVQLRVIRETDPQITAIVNELREGHGFPDEADNTVRDDKLHEFASEARMEKDDFEVREIRRAVDATKHGFDNILKKLPSALGKPRSERILEGAFNAVSREEGNEVGYDTIIASGAHAPILHWIRNTGTVNDGELLLIDAGVEVDSLYTADITRTFPTNGKFTDFQRKLYQAVLDSQQAGFEAAKPGATYSDIHHACMRVIAERLHDWGILPVDVEESLSPEGQQHRRWLACGVAHHLGLDVHDCAQARYESYQGAKITPGMVFTIEPGLYFREDDLMIPPEYRGIGIRIEDDVLMTEDGPEWISAGIPKQIDDVEAWMAQMADTNN
ncbi:Xaa-Pro aminopeptidase [Bifidobacterium animalis subsp. lactis ATCC 27673]|nr:Xaa-Pro aminopeptidase [Bifidobacterium animalis subsp. lactis ATCC 27673]